MSDYFPPELLVEILLKLPIKSLIRFTAVCKSWQSVITNPSFISAHLDQAKNKSLLLLKRCDTGEDHFSLLEIAGKDSPFCIISSSELELPVKSQSESFKIVGSCRGIVCLSDKRTFLWNPSIRKHLVLPEGVISLRNPSHCVLGFGVAPDNDFKVVRLVFQRRPDGFYYYCPSLEAEVFSLRTGRWRRLRGLDARCQIVPNLCSQVFLNGVVHWLGYSLIDKDHGRTSILTFHVGEEVFDEITLPYELAKEPVINLSLTSVGESLAVIKYDKYFGEGGCEVWLMEEYAVQSSWTRRDRFLLMEGMVKVLAYRKNHEALVASHGAGLIIFDLANWEGKSLGIHGTTHSFCVENFVETLEMLGSESKITKEVEGAEEDLI